MQKAIINSNRCVNVFTIKWPKGTIPARARGILMVKILTNVL